MVAGTPPASAANNGRYSVFPATISGNSARPFFNYVVNPDSTVKDAVTVTNYTPVSIEFKLFAADAINAQGGGFALNPPNAPKRSVGSWVGLSAEDFTLPPHTLANVPFTIKVPPGLPPGDYAGGIVLQTAQPSIEKRGAFTFEVYQNVGTRMYVRIAGPLHPGLAITKLSVNTHGWLGLVGGPVDADVTYTVTNTGNQVLNPTTRLSVSPLLGSTVTIPPRIFPSLLPHSSATVTYQLKNQEALLKITADLKVTSRAGVTTASTTTWVIPWLLILALVLLLLFLWWLYRRRHREVGDAEGVADTGDVPGGPDGTDASGVPVQAGAAPEGTGG